MFTKTPFEPGKEGVWLDLPASVYHAAPGVSQSALKEFDDYASPKHYRTRKPRKATENMMMGTVCHTAVLEPDNLADSYYVRPDEFKRGEKDKWLELHWDKPYIYAEQEAAIPKIVQAVKDLTEFAGALASGHREVSFFKRDPETGLLLKCRTDALAFEVVEPFATWIFDLKKVQSGGASQKEFSKSVADYGYHIQCSAYKFITGAARFVFVPFDDSEPFDAAQWELDEETERAGAFEYRRILNAFAECVKSERWPGYNSGIGRLGLPDYAKKKLTQAQHEAWALRVATGNL